MIAFTGWPVSQQLHCFHGRALGPVFVRRRLGCHGHRGARTMALVQFEHGDGLRHATRLLARLPAAAAASSTSAAFCCVMSSILITA
jgi:hypothetical protein